MNKRFQNALRGIAQSTPPIWFMRQAGRYHQHYQGLRQAHSFMELCKSPSLAAEVALGPVQDFDFDVAILFSDLLFPLEALGLGLTYDPGPKLERRLTPDLLKKLRSYGDALDGLRFQGEAVRETRKRLPSDKSLIGFVGGPWTLFTYSVEGEHKGSLIESKVSLPLFRAFCETLVPLLEANIQLQLDGGAELVMLFDTAAGEVSPDVFRAWIQPCLEQLSRRFSGKLGYYAKGVTAAHIAGLRSTSEFAGFGYDHRFELPAVLQTNARGFVQGNFDQALLFLKGKDFELEMERYFSGFRLLTPVQRRHWVCGLGHGVLPGTPEENVRAYIRRAREVFA